MTLLFTELLALELWRRKLDASGWKVMDQVWPDVPIGPRGWT